MLVSFLSLQTGNCVDFISIFASRSPSSWTSSFVRDNIQIAAVAVHTNICNLSCLSLFVFLLEKKTPTNERRGMTAWARHVILASFPCLIVAVSERRLRHSIEIRSPNRVHRTNDEFMAARYSSMNQRSASDLYECAKVNSYAQPCASETL